MKSLLATSRAALTESQAHDFPELGVLSPPCFTGQWPVVFAGRTQQLVWEAASTAARAPKQHQQFGLPMMSVSAMTTMRFMIQLLLGLLSDFLEVFLGILIEVLNATLAAELDFLIFDDQHGGLAHLAEFITRDDAGRERIGFGLGICGDSEGGTGRQNDK